MTALTLRQRVREFRQTRPFWGGLLLMLAGAEITYVASSSLGVIAPSGWDESAGHFLGIGLLLFGLVSWFAPVNGPILGILGVVVALAAFVASNFGGLLLGTLLGIIGGSMVWAWGEVSRRSTSADDSADEDDSMSENSPAQPMSEVNS